MQTNMHTNTNNKHMQTHTKTNTSNQTKTNKYKQTHANKHTKTSTGKQTHKQTQTRALTHHNIAITVACVVKHILALVGAVHHNIAKT